MTEKKRQPPDTPANLGHLRELFTLIKTSISTLEPMLQLLETPDGEASPIQQLQEILEAILYDVRQIMDVREDQKLILKNQKDILRKLDSLLLQRS